MTAPIPVYADSLDWRTSPGAELASVGTQEHEELDSRVESRLGLAYDDKHDRWVSPRADAIRRQEIRVEDLDDEELIRGQVRDADGHFRHGPLRQIPREFHDELMRRILDRGMEKLRSSYLAAIDVIVDGIVEDRSVDIRLRYDAAKYVIERLAGRTPERVEVGVEMKKWETVMTKIIKEIPGSEQPVIDGEVVDDEDEEEELA